MHRSDNQGTNVTLLADGITTSDGYRKSRRSQGTSNCAEVKKTGPAALLRDTQNRHLGALGFSAREWAAFASVAE